MQIDGKFVEAIEFVRSELKKVYGLEEQWVEQMESFLGTQLEQAKIESATRQFPEDNSVVSKFSVEGLQRLLEDAVTSQTHRDGVVVSNGQIQALNLQVQFLISLQRYFGRRKQTRAQRIVNASHRRAILAHDRGPIQAQLRGAVDKLLVES